MTLIRNLPDTWDAETDLIAVGSGGGGLAAAITASEHGLDAMVLERTDLVGGVTAYSMGEVWVPGNHHAAAMGIEDSPESGFRYVKRLSLDYGDDRAILNQAVHAPAALRWFEEQIGLRMTVIRHCPDYYYGATNDSVSEGRLLEVEPFPAETLGEWQHRTRISPHVLYGMTHADIFDNGGSPNILAWDWTVMGERLAKDERCLGPGLAGYFVKGALDRGIPLLTGVNVEELIGDGERIVGVKATRDGKPFFVKARKGVVIAVSSYERNRDYGKTIGQQLEAESVIMPEADGAHLRLAGPFGARTARVPDVTMLAIRIPGEELQEGVPLWRGVMPYIGLPHTIVVNRAGRRFANESFYRSIYFETDRIAGNDQTHVNMPSWMVIDSQARGKYPIGSLMPGQELPESMAIKADSLAELADKAGFDAAGFLDTVARWNGYCAEVRDPEFGRGEHLWGQWMSGHRGNKPHPNFGTIEQGPFYALPLSRVAGSGIAAGGLLCDTHSRVMGWNGMPIEGLYAAGNSVARLDNGAVMQSGMSNARGMTQGWLAGKHAAGSPSDLLESEAARLGL